MSKTSDQPTRRAPGDSGDRPEPPKPKGSAEDPGEAARADRGKEEAVKAVATLNEIGALEAEPAETPDAKLVSLARRGDHAAFETLVRRYSERAYRAAYRVVRDAAAAEDIVQEALIKAYRGLRKFESRSSFYTWLYRIVVNLALDRRRREKRAPMTEWDDSVAQEIEPRAVAPVTGNPETSSRRHEIRTIVAEGVQLLPDGQREVLLLREVEGLSYEEIAQTMGISKGTVMSRLHYARKKMVAYLSEAGIEPEDAR